MQLINLLFSFEGRIGRSQFWLAMAIWVGVAVGLFLLLGGMSALLGVNVPTGITYTLATIVYVPMLISSVAVGIKRLHDRNKSAWWLLLFYLLPLALPWIGLLFQGGASTDPDALPFIVIVLIYARFAIVIWALVELGLMRGSIGGNPYGTDPLAPRPAQH